MILHLAVSTHVHLCSISIRRRKHFMERDSGRKTGWGRFNGN